MFSSPFYYVSLYLSLDELFRQLNSKLDGLYLLGFIDNDLPVLAELRKLVSKLVRPETLATISAFSLD